MIQLLIIQLLRTLWSLPPGGLNRANGVDAISGMTGNMCVCMYVCVCVYSCYSATGVCIHFSVTRLLQGGGTTTWHQLTSH